MLIPRLLFLLCLGSTLFMTGLIWFVQVVHYPLFARVETAAFGRYHADHCRLTGYVVIVPMTVELLSSILLVAYRPRDLPASLVWAGLAAAALTWLSTALVQVPLHGRLSGGFDPLAHRRLVLSNAVRTLVWSLHAVLVLVMAWRAIRI